MTGSAERSLNKGDELFKALQVAVRCSRYSPTYAVAARSANQRTLYSIQPIQLSILAFCSSPYSSMYFQACFVSFPLLWLCPHWQNEW